MTTTKPSRCEHDPYDAENLAGTLALLEDFLLHCPDARTELADFAYPNEGDRAVAYLVAYLGRTSSDLQRHLKSHAEANTADSADSADSGRAS